MEFKNDELVEREIEIGSYLIQNFSIKQIAEKTGLSKKILTAHISNMMIKLKVESTKALITLLKQME